MSNEFYKQAPQNKYLKAKELTPDTFDAFAKFNKAAMAEGALPQKTKELVAVAVAHTTQCPACIDIHTKAAKKHGATEQELMEAIWVAAALRAGGSVVHSSLSLHSYEEG